MKERKHSAKVVRKSKVIYYMADEDLKYLKKKTRYTEGELRYYMSISLTIYNPNQFLNCSLVKSNYNLIKQSEKVRSVNDHFCSKQIFKQWEQAFGPNEKKILIQFPHFKVLTQESCINKGVLGHIGGDSHPVLFPSNSLNRQKS